MRMNFSEGSEESYFFSQPHQPFFILAFVNAIFTMLIFMLSYKGVIHLAVSPNTFHVYGLVYLLFTPAFIAFLFTTFPRFASVQAISKEVYMRIFGLFYLAAVLFMLGAIVSPVISSLGMVILLAGHTMAFGILKKIHDTTAMSDKHDLFWILLAMGFGVVSHLLYVISELFFAPLQGFATQMAIYLYLFLLTFSVAQRMVPFFSHCMIDKNVNLLKIVSILLALHVVLETLYPHLSFPADLALAFVIGRELKRWGLPFPNENPLLWILHISLFWVPVAFFLGAVSNLLALFLGINVLFLDIHTLMLGFVFTILIGFGTRVTIGHSGNMMQADKWTKRLFIWTQVVVAIRILTSMVAALGWNYMILFDISATTWILMFIFWAVRFFAVLISGKKLV